MKNSGTRTVVDYENRCTVGNLTINKDYFKQTTKSYPAIWCDYPRPLFAGDDSYLIDVYEEYAPWEEL